MIVKELKILMCKDAGLGRLEFIISNFPTWDTGVDYAKIYLGNGLSAKREILSRKWPLPQVSTLHVHGTVSTLLYNSATTFLISSRDIGSLIKLLLYGESDWVNTECLSSAPENIVIGRCEFVRSSTALRRWCNKKGKPGRHQSIVPCIPKALDSSCTGHYACDKTLPTFLKVYQSSHHTLWGRSFCMYEVYWNNEYVEWLCATTPVGSMTLLICTSQGTE